MRKEERQGTRESGAVRYWQHTGVSQRSGTLYMVTRTPDCTAAEIISHTSGIAS